jgi:hypothetical protein
MAGYCTGVTVNWRGNAIGEVSEFRVGAGGSLPQSRGVSGGKPWSLDAGTVELASFSTAAMNLSEYGMKGLLSFTGGGLTLTTKAICQTLDITGKVNDVYRLKSVFRIVQE